MRVGVYGHDRVAEIVFDKCETLPTRCVVAVYMRLLSKHGPELRVGMRSDNIFFDVIDKFFLVLLQIGLFLFNFEC